MPYSVGSNFPHHAADPNGEMARRVYVNSVDYTAHVTKWPTVKRDWNSVSAANVSISLDNSSRLFNFFTADKTRLRDSIDIDYGVRYRSHNLFTWSHVFSASDWTKLNVGLVPDAVSNPVGGEVDAYKVFGNANVNTRHFAYQNVVKPVVFDNGAEHWSAFHAKQAECLAVRMEIFNGGVSKVAYFDVESGTVLSVIGSLDAFIRQETQGWYHCGARYATVGSDYVRTVLEPTNPNSKTQYNFTNNGSDGLYLYGAQMQVASYFESHQYFMTGASRQNPYGMNLGKYTEVFSGSDWSKDASVFVTNNVTHAPDGNATATVIQNSNNSVSGSIAQALALSPQECAGGDHWQVSAYAKQGAAVTARLLVQLLDVSSENYSYGHDLHFDFSQNTATTNGQYRSQAGSVSSGDSWVSRAGVEYLDDGWRRLWATIRNPGTHQKLVNQGSRYFDTLEARIYPSVSPNSGTTAFWGFQIDKGDRELLDGPGPYVAVHTGTQVYPSNAEDTINLFDGTVRDANYGRGSIRLQSRDKLTQLSERIVGTGEVPVAVDSITPSWLAFTLCSCYGGFSAVQSTNNTDIDWAAVNSWDAHNTANTVHVKADLRGIKVTEALRRISRMTRVAIFLEEDRITFRRWTNVDTQVLALDNTSMLDNSLSVNDENLVNKQWIFGDWDQSSEYYKLSLFDEDTASQNSFGLHERVIKDQAIFYVTSGAALDTAQRIVSNEADPIDSIEVTAIPSALRMQIGESISITDPELQIAGTYRIMNSKIDMNKDEVTFGVDNSQLLLANPFTLDTSSLGGTDVLV